MESGTEDSQLDFDDDENIKGGKNKKIPNEDESTIIYELVSFLIDFVDSKTGQLLFEPFINLPSISQYPDYYEIVKQPIDLTQMMAKAENNQYSSLEALHNDMKLLVDNAKLYNEPGSWIFRLGKQLNKTYAIKKLELIKKFSKDPNSSLSKGPSSSEKRTTRSRRLETSIISDDDETQSSISKQSSISQNNQSMSMDYPEDMYHTIFEKIKTLKHPLAKPGSTELLYEPFYRLPSSYHYPDYYEEIARPVAMTQIQGKIRKNAYTSVVELLDDLYTMFNNAMIYNMPNSKIYRDAAYFKKYVRGLIPQMNLQVPSDYISKLDDIDASLNKLPQKGVAITSGSFQPNQNQNTPIKSEYGHHQSVSENNFNNNNNNAVSSISSEPPRKKGRPVRTMIHIKEEPGREKYHGMLNYTNIANTSSISNNNNNGNIMPNSSNQMASNWQQTSASVPNNNQFLSSANPPNNNALTVTHNARIAQQVVYMFNDIVQLKDETNYNLVLYFTKKSHTIPTFVDLTDVEKALRAGHYTSPTKLLDDIYRILEAFKLQIYNGQNPQAIAINPAINAPVDFRVAHRAACLLQDYIVNNVRFKEILEQERSFSQQQNQFMSTTQQQNSIAPNSYANTPQQSSSMAKPAGVANTSLAHNQQQHQQLTPIANTNVAGPNQTEVFARALRNRMKGIYNELVNLSDPTTKKVFASAFVKLPSKSEYPEYYQIITHPIDLTTVNYKLCYVPSQQQSTPPSSAELSGNATYQNVQEFFADLDLMLSNAFAFNDPESIIYKDALILYKFVQDKRTELCEEMAGKPDVKLRTKALFISIFVGVVTYKDGTTTTYYSDLLQECQQAFTDKFLDLPKPYFNPLYRDNPMTLEIIKRYLDMNKYERLDIFQEHVLYFLSKAMYYILHAIKCELDASLNHKKQSNNIDDVNGQSSASLVIPSLPNTNEKYKAVIALVYRYFALRDKYCLRLVKKASSSNAPNVIPGSVVSFNKFFVLKSALAFSKTDKGNNIQYFVHELPELLWKHLYDTTTTTKIATSEQNSAVSNVKLEDGIIDENNGVSMDLVETNSNSNDVNSSFGDWKRGGPDDEPLETHEINGMTLSVGDFIYYEPKDKGIPDPHIMCIQSFPREEKIKHNTNSGVDNTAPAQLYIHGCWFYRPYETFHPANKRFFAQEVFKSDVFERIHPSRVRGKCLVLFYKDYIKYKTPPQFDNKDVFVCESRYFTKLKAFKRIKHWHHISPSSDVALGCRPSPVTFVARETPLVLVRQTPSVFADRSFTQFVQQTSIVPEFPTSLEDMVPSPSAINNSNTDDKISAAAAKEYEGVKWPLTIDANLPQHQKRKLSTGADPQTIPSPKSFMHLTVGDYVLVQLKNASSDNNNNVSFILLIDRIYSSTGAVQNVVGDTQASRREILCCSGSCVFTFNPYDIFAYSGAKIPPYNMASGVDVRMIEQQAKHSNPGFVKNAKDVFLLSSNNDRSNPAMASNIITIANSSDSPYALSGRKLHILGAETFSRKWPTQIDETDLYVCRYQINPEYLVHNPPANNPFLLPFVYEAICAQKPPREPIHEALRKEWYHFDNNEIYDDNNNTNNTTDTNIPPHTNNVVNSGQKLQHTTAAYKNDENDAWRASECASPYQNLLAQQNNQQVVGVLPSGNNGARSMPHGQTSSAISQHSALSNLLAATSATNTYYAKDSIVYNTPRNSKTVVNFNNSHKQHHSANNNNKPSMAEVFFGSTGETGTSLSHDHPNPNNLSVNLNMNNALAINNASHGPSGRNNSGQNTSTVDEKIKEFCSQQLKLSLDDEDYNYILKRAKPSGYIMYAGERRQELTEKHPDQRFGQISKMIGAGWKQLTAEEKAVYEDKANTLGDELKALVTKTNFTSGVGPDGKTANPNSQNGGGNDSADVDDFSITPGTTATPADKLARRIQKLIKRSHKIKRNSTTGYSPSIIPSVYNSAGPPPSLSSTHPPEATPFSGQFAQQHLSGNLRPTSNLSLNALSQAPPPTIKQYLANGIYACLWENCDFQFAELQDLVDHVTFQTDHIKARDGEYTCKWAHCWKQTNKDKEPKFLTQGRLIRHLRESHFGNALIRNLRPEHISPNFIVSSKALLQGTTLGPRLQLPNTVNNNIGPSQVDSASLNTGGFGSIMGGGNDTSMHGFEDDNSQNTTFSHMSGTNMSGPLINQHGAVHNMSAQSNMAAASVATHFGGVLGLNQLPGNNIPPMLNPNVPSSSLLPFGGSRPHQLSRQIVVGSGHLNGALNLSLSGGAAIGGGGMRGGFINNPNVPSNTSSIPSYGTVIGGVITEQDGIYPGLTVQLKDQAKILAGSGLGFGEDSQQDDLFEYENGYPVIHRRRQTMLTQKCVNGGDDNNTEEQLEPMFVIPPPPFKPKLSHSAAFIEHVKRMAARSSTESTKNTLPSANDDIDKNGLESWIDIEKPVLPNNGKGGCNQDKDFKNPEAEKEINTLVRKAKLHALNVLRDSMLRSALSIENWISSVGEI